MTITVSVKGFHAAVLGYAYDSGLIYLRFVGVHNAVRAIWAHLVSDRAQSGQWLDVRVGKSSGLSLHKGVRYRVLQTPLPDGLLDMAFLHPRLTTADDGEEDPESIYFVLLKGQAGPPPGLFERLNRHLSLPLLPEWAGWLWCDGLAGLPDPQGYSGPRTTITPLDTPGVEQVYQVSLNSALHTWQAIVRKNASLLTLAVSTAQAADLAAGLPPDAPATLLERWPAAGGDLEVNLAEAIVLYGRAQALAGRTSGLEHNRWLALQTRLYVWLSRAASEGLIDVVDWERKPERRRARVYERLPYDQQHRLYENLRQVTADFRRAYGVGGDGQPEADSLAALAQAEAALAGLNGQLPGLASPAEQEMIAHYRPLLEALQRAHREREFPHGSAATAYKTYYEVERIEEKKCRPLAFAWRGPYPV